ncbi:MAG: nitrous oxide reductase family maturation protein NosD [Saprospiraceae bacterium]|nr:nitrous oxide reductase family maturation protein NosD [Saprospiraceae bacterium]
MLAMAFPLSAVQYIVGGVQGHATIAEALHLASAGDTVMVMGGTYREGNLLIDKPLTFIGVGRPLLDGENVHDILTLSGRNIIVMGFRLENSGISAMNDLAAIKCIDITGVHIEDNQIARSHFAIHLANASDIVVRNNSIEGVPRSEHNTGNGIHLWKCKSALIEENDISGHRDGIYFEFVSDSRIRCNTSRGNLRYGLHFMFSNDDRYEGNRFIENGAGVAVMYSRKVTMEQNEFLHNWGNAAYGLLLKDITDSYIGQNYFVHNTVGIFMEGSSRMQILWNSFSKNGWAMRIQASCNDNRISLNNFSGNTFDIATNGTLVLNDFDRNYWDKYDGYDRTRDGMGDVPYRPVSMYSMVVERNPFTLILLRSILISFLDKAEKAIPSITPELLIDRRPLMKPVRV